jgi:ABC-type lipoprotein release transport system permease subunit
MSAIRVTTFRPRPSRGLQASKGIGLGILIGMAIWIVGFAVWAAFNG